MEGDDSDLGGRPGEEDLLGIHTGGKDANLTSEVSAGGSVGIASVGPTAGARQVTPDRMVEDGDDDDIFPLAGIWIKRDINWTESREGNATAGSREAGGIV